MPREIAFGDALVPGLLVLFVLSLVLLWLLDWVAGRFGLYRLVWHPSLFRLALFVCVFGSFALLLF
jgi:protein AaeX